MSEPKLSGQIVPDVPPVDKALIGAFVSEAMAQRQAMFRRAIRRRPDIAKELERVHESVSSILAKATLIDGRLDPKSQLAIVSSVYKTVPKAMEAVRELIRREVAMHMDAAMVAQNKTLQAVGLSPVSRDVRTAILKRHLRVWMDEEFPSGSGMTFAKRIARHEQLLGSKILNRISDVPGARQGLEEIAFNVDQSILGKGVGRTPVKGGSTYKQMHRMLVAEQSRKANDVSIELLQSAGVEFGRWTLHTDHRWYGGREICEVLAGHTPDITLFEIQRMGLSSASLDLRGVYPLDHWPKFPHPFCKCSPVPFYPPTLRDRLLENTAKLTTLWNLRRMYANEEDKNL